MPRKKPKGLSYYGLLWAAPTFAIVMAPFILHAAAAYDLSESTDDHMFAVLAMLLAVVSLSVLGCVLDESFACPRSFPLVLFMAQLSLVVITLILRSSVMALERKIPANAPAKSFVHRFLSHQAKMPNVQDFYDDVHVITTVTHTQTAPVLAPVAAAPVAQVAPAVPPVVAKQEKIGASIDQYTKSGVGYCEDANTRQEFSSLHANGKTLEECAKAGVYDHQSIGFDFTQGDGGCDVRFPAGALAKRQAGFDWWGWGAGVTNPRGFGTNKHDLPTTCYAKIMVATKPPTTVTWTDPPKRSAAEVAALKERGRGRFSIVLPCAAEATFMVNTVKKFCERTPDEYLQEIIVVDDGTDIPLINLLMDVEPRCKLHVLRHAQTMGLMIAKQTGGDAATGEYIGFFDCHVSPNKVWYREMIDILKSGPRRMAVPTITDLDLDTWEEKEQSQVNSKCYIDFNAQFMWFEDESDFIPVISGGLVALTRQWWEDSAGFDSKMRGWGGENVDQSLRTWLCGGEILRAKTSRVAHMWRVPSDQRTQAHYRHVLGVDNIARVAAAWFDKFQNKYRDGLLMNHRPDVTNVEPLKRTLQCKPYAYFLHRFRKVYKDGGVLPAIVYKIKSKKTGRCIQRQGQKYAMWECSQGSWFHAANQDPKKKNKCCSGIREWNAMECFDRLDHEGVFPYYCDVTGKNINQEYPFTDDGRIEHPYTNACVSVSDSGALFSEPCATAAKWERFETFVPSETSTYESEIKSLGFDERIPDN